MSEVASVLASLQVAEEGGFGERLPANNTGLLISLASRLSHEASNGFRSALGLSPLVVVDDGPDADEQAVGETGCPDDACCLKHGMTSMI